MTSQLTNIKIQYSIYHNSKQMEERIDPGLPASLIISSAGGEAPSNKDHRDLDRLNLDAKEVIFTALKFDIENYVKQEFYKNVLPLVQKTSDQ